MSCCWNCKKAIQRELYNIQCIITMNEHDENHSCDEHEAISKELENKRLNEVYW